MVAFVASRWSPLVSVLLLACGNAPNDAVGARDGGVDATSDPRSNTASPDAGAAADAASSMKYLTQLNSAADFAAVAGEGAEVKYLAREGDSPMPSPFDSERCVFQNTQRYPYHLLFLRTFEQHAMLSPEAYEDLVLRSASRQLWVGQLKWFAATVHPETQRQGVIAYTVYADADDRLTVDQLVDLDQRLKDCAPYASDLLVLVPDGSAQLSWLPALTPQLQERGVAVVKPGDLRPGLTAEAYSEGEGFGYLNLVPEGQMPDAVGPHDVLITEAALSDLTIVSGLVTRLPQSLGSHLNLRFREKGIPSAALPGIYDNPLLAGLDNQLVHIVVKGAEVTIEPARIEQATEFWARHRPVVGQPVADLNEEELAALDELGHGDANVYGTKAANLAELGAILPPDNRVKGFAIPFRAYADFMTAHGLFDVVEDLLNDPQVGTDRTYKRDRLKDLRKRIRAAPLLPEFVVDLSRRVEQTYGEAGAFTRLRFRSSTNVEDLPGLTGAGLYDSRSGCLADDEDADDAGPSACLTEEQEIYLRGELARRRQELSEHPDRSFLAEIILDLEDDLSAEKSALLAVRRVWASLWNERAFDDREYYGLDHRLCFMGIAVHPTFVGEQLEAVVVTNLEPEAERPLYRVVSQAGEVGVVDPDEPTATPEVLTLRRGPANQVLDVTLVAASSLVPAGAQLWNAAQLNELAALLFLVQDHFSTLVYPELDPLQLDLEVDVTSDGHAVVKQARPYVSPDW